MRISTEKSKLQTSKLLTNYFCVLFLIALYYLWYRYPFRINSSGTSPTYSDTPYILQILKYTLFFATVGIFTVLPLLARRSRWPRYRLGWWMAIVIVVWFIVQSGLVAIITSDLVHFESVIFLFALIPLMFYSRSFKIRLTIIERFLRWFIYITTASFVLQVLLFITVGRLPALAYQGSLFVRFGGLWDDPNGFAVFLSFIIPFIYFSEMRHSRKILLIVINLVSLIATQSLTGIFAFVASLFLVTGCLFLRPVARQWARRIGMIYLWLAIFAFVGLTALMIFNLKFDLTGLAIRYLEGKQPSMNIHMESWSMITQGTGLPTILGMEPTGRLVESGYATLLLNFGVFTLLAYVLFLLAIFWKTINVLRAYHDQPGIAVFYGAAFFSAAYGVAMLNLPLQTVFPINLLFILFAILAFQTYRIVDWQDLANSDVGR